MDSAGTARGDESRRDIVVIGGSAGSIGVLRRLLGGLPPDFSAAVLVAIHRAPVGPGGLSSAVSGSGPLPTREAVDGDRVTPGEVLLAPADRHLHLDGEQVRVVRGPHENRSRPAIDPLFRSAAVSHTTRVVAVLLSGMLDDGTSGVGAVKRCGGVVLVQDPADAEYPEMPETALRYWEVDHVAPIDDLAALLVNLTRSVAPPSVEVPADLVAEARASLDGSALTGPSQKLVGLACPDCGGPLSLLENEDGPRQFRCEVGHIFSDHALLFCQADAIERALWIAVRSLEERARTLESIASDQERNGGVRATLAQGSQERAAESRNNAALIRRLLSSNGR